MDSSAVSSEFFRWCRKKWKFNLKRERCTSFNFIRCLDLNDAVKWHYTFPHSFITHSSEITFRVARSLSFVARRHNNCLELDKTKAPLSTHVTYLFFYFSLHCSKVRTSCNGFRNCSKPKSSL